MRNRVTNIDHLRAFLAECLQHVFLEPGGLDHHPCTCIYHCPDIGIGEVDGAPRVARKDGIALTFQAVGDKIANSPIYPINQIFNYGTISTILRLP